MPKILLRLLLCIGFVNASFSVHASNLLNANDDLSLSDSEVLSFGDSIDKFRRVSMPITINNGLTKINISYKKSLELIIRLLASPSEKNINIFSELYKSFIQPSSQQQPGNPSCKGDTELIDALGKVNKVKASEYFDEISYKNTNILIQTIKLWYPSMPFLDNMKYYFPKDFPLLTGIVLNLHILLRHKALLKSRKIAMFNFLYCVASMSEGLFLSTQLASFRSTNLRLVQLLFKFLHPQERGSNCSLSNQISVPEQGVTSLTGPKILNCMHDTNCIIYYVIMGLTITSMIGNVPLLKSYIPLTNIFLLRNHNFNARLKRLEVGLQTISYLMGVSINCLNQSFIPASTNINNVFQIAKQEKQKIEDLSKFSDALTNGYFLSYFLGLDEKKYNKGISSIIFNYIFEKGTDYEVVDLKNAKKQKFSFFDAQDEAQAIELCMKRSQKTENKFAKYTSRAASFSLGLFASYSIWKWFNTKSNPA